MASSNAADSEDELASGDEDDRASNAPSSSAAEGAAGHHLQRYAGSPPSRTASPSISSAPTKGKRRTTIKDEVGHMTAEELDALPPAKRRKGAKARGAPGPGRGWRKGLKMGQKPIYALPDTTPIAEGTPSTLASDFNRASPTVLSPSPMRTSSATMASAASNNKVLKGSSIVPVASAGNTSFPQTAIQKQPPMQGRPSQAVAAVLGFGPPVKQPPKLINAWAPPSGAAGTPSEALNTFPSQRPRRWFQEERQIVNLGGRVIKLKAWWGGKNASFDPILDREREEAWRSQVASDATRGRSALDADESINGSPFGSKTSTPRPSATSVLQAATAALSATNNLALSRGGSIDHASRLVAAAAAKAGGGSAVFYKGTAGLATEHQPTTASSPSSTSSHAHLPKPKFQPGAASIADWKASSVGRQVGTNKK